MSEQIPNKEHRSVVTIDDVRMYIMDRTAADNPLELDLFWTDKEIAAAMNFTAMKYNDIPPPVHYVTAMTLPFAGVFLDGICYFLMLGMLMKLGRNDIEYQAGNMSVNINKRRIEFLNAWAPIFKSEFESKAQEQKRMINIDNAFSAC